MEKRNTVQKELVYRAVTGFSGHVTAEEVYAAISREHPSVSKGTVYRNLNSLAEDGKILKIEVPNGADRFDHTCGRHYHAQCTVCGGIFDVDTDCTCDEILGRLKNTYGFRVTDFDLGFKGVCPGCMGEKEKENA